MRAPTTAPAEPTLAGFGLSCTQLHIDPEASTMPDSLLFDALCLIGNALEVFDRIADDGDAPPTFFAGLYALRQGKSVLDAAQGKRAREIAAGAKPTRHTSPATSAAEGVAA
jgi:hypothetical protein